MQTHRSEKINLIDFATFKQIQQSESSTKCATPHIRNAKYRKKHKSDENNFNLAAWINQTKRVGGYGVGGRVQKARAHFKKGATLINKTSGIKKSGKISRNRRKKLTRLKKTIMKYRVVKHQNNAAAAEETDDGNLLKVVAQAQIRDAITNDAAAIANPNVNIVEPLIMQINKIDLNTTSDALKDLNVVDKTAANLKEDKNITVISDNLSNLTLHSRRFRDYCDNCTTQDLAKITNELLGDLNHFQRRAYAKNPVKANAHRRFVVGFREAQNHLNVKFKVKLVIIATDCEKCTEAGGIDSIIAAIKSNCQAAAIPYCFPFDRRQLAYALHKKGIVSCVAILDYDGVRAKFTELVAALDVARQKYLAATV